MLNYTKQKKKQHNKHTKSKKKTKKKKKTQKYDHASCYIQEQNVDINKYYNLY